MVPMNTALLKRHLRARALTQEALSERLGLDRCTLNRKMHGARKGFYLPEVHALVRELGLSQADMLAIFFPDQEWGQSGKGDA